MQEKDSQHYGDNKSFALTVAAPIEDVPRDEKTPATILAVFDENDVLLATAPVRRGVAKLTLPIRHLNRMLRVFHGPLDESIKRPTPARMRRNLAIEELLLVGPDRELKLCPLPYRHLRLSCCRVRGRIVMPVKRPDGSVDERPLCNARVVICEVDASIPWIIWRLPNDLVFRLRDEWLAAIRLPPGGPDPSPELHAVRAGLHLTLREDTMAMPKVGAPLRQLAHTMAVAQIREELIANIKLLRPFWCAFPWLDRFYSLDCLKTVEVDADGSFDTEIHYPCHGDHPDLYFKVEQDCHPGGWLTVYAPPIHCNTYWDYCCGTPAKITVTDPQAAPGRAPSPCVWPYSAGDPASVGSWELLPYTSGVFVVHAALMHTGKVLMFSGTAEVNLPKESRVWDPDTGVMTAQNFGEDFFCCGHATLPDGRILINGGASTAGRGIRSTNIFDPATETWGKVADMNHARWYPTTLSLPDGRILTVSGRDQNGAVTAPMEVYDPWTPNTPSLQAEMFDPQAETWTPMASMTVARQYHSVSVLLSDARVLNTGSVGAGGNLMSMEVYSPPYLFRGPRPKISSWPAALGYGEVFTVESPDACRIDKACLIKTTTITHHTNTDQRYLPLRPMRHGHCGLRMTSPANANLAPPGHYLLFLLDDCGAPSVGRFVRIG